LNNVLFLSFSINDDDFSTCEYREQESTIIYNSLSLDNGSTEAQSSRAHAIGTSVDEAPKLNPPNGVEGTAR
jgi:hypothetical protein